jgi:translation initiation factor IF-3
MEVLIIRKNDVPINEEIMEKEVRLIDADGSMIGIISTKEALQMAISKNLDLVKIAANATPPVCKIIDYGKVLFEQSKKDKEAKKNQKIVSLKEIRITPTIEEHDFDFKVKNAFKFLEEGNKVKISIRFRGRELRYTSNGLDALAKFADAVKDVGIIEKQPRLEGKSMAMILNPKK